MQAIKVSLLVVLFFAMFGIAQFESFKAPREAVEQCNSCNGGIVGLFETISTELCALKNSICCVGQQGNCPARVFIRQADIPYVISEPGIYVVCENITHTDPILPAISIQSDGVTLDLAGNMISSELTYALELNEVNQIIISGGTLSTEGTSSLRVNNVTQLFVSDIIVARSPNNAFALNDLTQAVFDNCYFNNSFNVASGFDPYVFLITGSSSAIIVSNSQVVGPAVNGFGVLGNSSGYAITFENCGVYSTKDIYNGTGFYARSHTNGLRFNSCNVLDMNDYGFWISQCSDVVFNNCSAAQSRDGGFFIDSSFFVSLDSCSVQTNTFGIILSSVSTASILNSAAYGIGFTGFFFDGIRITNSDDLYLYNNQVSNFDGSQYAVFSSENAVFESCTGTAIIGAESFSLFNSIAVLKNCTGIQAGTGVLGTTAFNPNEIVIKDSLFAQNNIGIDTLGTSFIILDTRSGNPLNINPDSVAGSTVITY